MTIDEQIEVMQYFRDGGEVEVNISGWMDCKNPAWNFAGRDYRKKEYQYPMWFKNKKFGYIVKFTDLKKGKVVLIGKYSPHFINTEKDNFIHHTDKDVWEQIEEPKQTETYYEVIYKSNSDGYKIYRQLVDQCEIDKLKLDNIEIIKTGRSWDL